jgi:FtsP/CotA-like multicopper oxidase with cupredoxin domain
MRSPSRFDRRAFLAGAAAVGGMAALAPLLPAWARSGTPGLTPDMPTLSGDDIALTVGHSPFTVGGRSARAVTINGMLPGPLIRLREGQNVRIAVTNTLEEDTSIHWHGVLLPFDMDGVPGVSFPGIRPGETFVYEFPIRHAGTFWYHSHSGFQEQLGHYGPLIFDPPGDDPVASDREHVLVLSDWSFLHPHAIFQKLKQEPGYFNRRQPTLAGLLDDDDPEPKLSLADRLMWDRMRMDPTDIADVTGSTYTYLINGHGPRDNWTALFRPGERVRLRIINASAMTVFNFRVPGLRMTVVQADGNNVRPVAVDEFQISVAETYDVIVEPEEERAFAMVAESVDRSGMGVATLAPRQGMTAAAPPLRPRPTLGLDDMGMSGMAHGAMHGAAPAPNPGFDRGVGVDMIAAEPEDAAGKPGLGLEDVDHKVLVYSDLVALEPNPDPRPPSRSLEIHLTGNMERFMWSFDGRKFSEIVEPIRFARNERVRVTLVNDTMMQHPIHLHGHFFEVVNGHAGRQPMKHTVNVLPGSKISFDLTADNPGDWAFHCHLLFHMHAGMFNVVTVRPLDGGTG